MHCWCGCQSARKALVPTLGDGTDASPLLLRYQTLLPAFSQPGGQGGCRSAPVQCPLVLTKSYLAVTSTSRNTAKNRWGQPRDFANVYERLPLVMLRSATRSVGLVVPMPPRVGGRVGFRQQGVRAHECEQVQGLVRVTPVVDVTRSDSTLEVCSILVLRDITSR